VVRALPPRPAMDTVPGDVQLRAAEPGRPLRTTRAVDHLPPGLEELQAEILDDRGPEPLRLVLRAAQELGVRPDSVRPHQAREVRPLECLRARAPDHLHGGKPTAVFDVPPGRRLT